MARVGSTSPEVLDDDHAFDPVHVYSTAVSSYAVQLPDLSPPNLKNENQDTIFYDIIMNPPLPYDGELLQSMQALISDPSVYGHDSRSVLPGTVVPSNYFLFSLSMGVKKASIGCVANRDIASITAA